MYTPKKLLFHGYQRVDKSRSCSEFSTSTGSIVSYSKDKDAITLFFFSGSLQSSSSTLHIILSEFSIEAIFA